MLNAKSSRLKRTRVISGAIEALEPRRLLSVVLNQPFNAITQVSGSYPTIIDLTQQFHSTTIDGTVVRFSLAYAGTTGNIDMELFDQQTPITVANFLKYVNSGTYNTTFFHRSLPNFIVQGGGYYFPSGNPVPTFGTIVNEFASSPRDVNGHANVRGTVAMALTPGDPNSADSQFFINVADNASDVSSDDSSLDTQNGGYTTFARVIGDGMTVVDQINALPTNAGFASPFDLLPVYNDDGTSPLTQANVVYVSSASVIQPISFSASSSDLTRVSPTISPDGKLVLTYQPNVTTSAPVTVTVTATDVEGATLTSSFTVTLTGGSNVSATFNNTRLDPSGASPVAFGSVQAVSGSTITRTFTLKNTGSDALDNLTYTVPPGYSIVGTPPTSLISGEPGDLVLQIDSSLTGEKDGTLLINAPSSGTPVFSIPLSATVDLPVTIGHGVKSVVFIQGTGSAATTATFSLGGAGTVDFSFSGDGLTSMAKGKSIIVSGDASLASMTLNQTTLGSKINLAAKGTSLIDIGTVTATGTAALGSFIAKQGRLTGALTFGFTTATDSQLRTLTLGQISGASINIGVNSDPKAALTLTANLVEDTDLVMGYPLKTVNVKAWNGTDGSIQGTNLGTLKVQSNLGVPITLTGALTSAAISGQLTGLWTISGAIKQLSAGSATTAFALQSNNSVNSVKIAGDFSGAITAFAIASVTVGGGGDGPAIIATGTTNASNQVINGDISKIAFKGNVSYGFFNAGNRIGTFSANSITQTRIYGGVDIPSGGSSFPQSLSAFHSPSSIGSIKLAGKGVATAFSINAIAAKAIGSLQLGTIQTVSGVTNGYNGVVADVIGTLAGLTDAGQRLNLHSLDTQDQIPGISGTAGQAADFQIGLL